MKTQPLPKPLVVEPEYSLADEVTFVLSASLDEKRVLLSTAIALVSQCLISGLPCEVRSLTQQTLARLENGMLTANPLLLAAASEMEPLLRRMLDQVREITLQRVRSQLTDGSSAPSPANNTESSS